MCITYTFLHYFMSFRHHVSSWTRNFTFCIKLGWSCLVMPRTLPCHHVQSHKLITLLHVIHKQAFTHHPIIIQKSTKHNLTILQTVHDMHTSQQPQHLALHHQYCLASPWHHEQACNISCSSTHITWHYIPVNTLQTLQTAAHTQ